MQEWIGSLRKRLICYEGASLSWIGDTSGRNTAPMLVVPRCGKRNVLKPGGYTGEALARRAQLRGLLQEAREVLSELG